MKELFCTNVGSHIWNMQTPKSDIDLVIVYMMDSKNLLLGKRIKGKQKQDKETNIDTTFYEISHVISHLIKGNCNFLWAIVSPIVIREVRTSLRDLKNIVLNNLSKNCFNSINGLAKHNIKHFIEKGDRESLVFKKKLNVIGRTLRFGINLLTWGKCIFDKVNITTEQELWDLKNQLNEAYKNSYLPEEPNRKPFENYLIKWRIRKLKEDGLI